MLKSCVLNSTLKKLLMILFVIFVIQGNAAVHAEKPTVVTGIFGEYSVHSDEMEGTADFGMHGLFSYRTLLANNGYASVEASALLSGLVPDADRNDFGNIHVLISTPAGNSRLEISGGLAASLAGIDDVDRFFLPEWQVLYRLERDRRSIRPYGSYSGYFFADAQETGSRYYNSIEAGVMHTPSVEFEYRGSIHTGFEQWVNEDRRDLVSGLNLQLHGLLGYFMNWKLAGDAECRTSTDESQNRVMGAFTAEFGWSPNRRFAAAVSTELAQEFFLESKARDHTLTHALRMDYMAADKIYLFAENEVSWENPFGNGFDTWGSQLKAGIDISMMK